MQLDRYYNIKTHDVGIYSDSLDEIVALVDKAKEEGSITDKEASLILSIDFKKQSKEEISGFMKSFFNTKSSEQHTLFVQFVTNHKTYA